MEWQKVESVLKAVVNQQEQGDFQGLLLKPWNVICDLFRERGH